MKMKRIYLVLLTVVAVMTSCHKPEYVPSTAERQGITSLTAYFTTGDFVDQMMAKLSLEEDDVDNERYVIPVPWFYPEETDNKTDIAMTRARIRAEIAPNCKIDPPLTILDLKEENPFVFTDSKGQEHNIIITGKRVKSSNAYALTFDIVSPVFVEGFVNEEASEIYLFTEDDLSNCTAESTPNRHSTVKTDLKVPKNYNEPQTVTYLAHDGKTERTYTIMKKTPVSIPYGFRAKSVKKLFNFEPVSMNKFPEYTDPVQPSMAYLDRTLVVSFGDGSELRKLNPLTGMQIGKINLGVVQAASITSDEGGNLLIAEYAAAGEECCIYKMESIDASPVLFYKFTNAADVPVGHAIKVVGNVDEQAVITLTHEGTSVTATGKYQRLTVSGGNVTESVLMDVVGLNICWGAAPTNFAKVCPVSVNPDDGVMFSFYENALTGELNTIKYINGNGKVAAENEFELMVSGNNASGNYNSNCMDVKRFNNAVYAAHLITSHFPMWGCGPILSIYDITAPTSIKAGMPVVPTVNVEWYQTAAAGCVGGDVLIARSADGFKVYMYYYDHNCGVIGGYSADCVKL